MLRAKKYALKPKYRGNKYVVVDNTIGVTTRGQPRSDKSGKNCGESVTLVLPTKRYKNNVKIHTRL
jgi:hypothetical protein